MTTRNPSVHDGVYISHGQSRHGRLVGWLLALTGSLVCKEAVAAVPPLRPTLEWCEVMAPDGTAGRIDVRAHYQPVDATTVADAWAATRKIEVCTIKRTGLQREFFCPYVLFNKDGGPELSAAAEQQLKVRAQTGESHTIITIPWGVMPPGDTNHEFFLRVNGEDCTSLPLHTLPVYKEGHACVVPRVLKEVDDPTLGRFYITGAYPPDDDPFVGAFGECRVDPNSGSHCTDPASVERVADLVLGVSKFQRERWFFSPHPPLDPPFWANVVNGQNLPMLVAVRNPGPGRGRDGYAAIPFLGGFAHCTEKVGDTGSAVLRMVGHEVVHSVQWGWIRSAVAAGMPQADAGRLGFGEPMQETLAEGLETQFCLDHYAPELVEDDLCVSPGHLGYAAALAGYNAWQGEPWRNPLKWLYNGGFAFRYFAEQYAVRRTEADDSAHPLTTILDGQPKDTTTSNRELPTEKANLPSLGDPRRHSDEGWDIVGHIYREFEANPPAQEYEPFDRALREHLGRGLDTVMQDLHAAMVLKDYIEVDPRWTFEWMGDFNAGRCASVWSLGTTPVRPMPSLRDLKPYPVYKDTISAWPEGDGVRRAHRLFDSWTPCLGFCPHTPSKLTPGPGSCITGPATTTCPVAGGAAASPSTLPRETAYKSTFGLNDTRAGLGVLLEPFGAAYFSISPSATLGELPVLINVTQGDVRLRVFGIDATGRPHAVDGCTGDPDGAGLDETDGCPLGIWYPNDIETAQRIALRVKTAGYKEIIGVVSARRRQATFDYLVGKPRYNLEIITPSISSPANVGAVGSAVQRRPFKALLSLQDDQTQLVKGVPPSSFSFEVVGCAAAPTGSCFIPQGDVELNEVSRGLYMVTAQLPASFYPAPPILTPGEQKLDLRVHVDGLPGGLVSATAEDALSVVLGGLRPKLVTNLVFDRSGSMGELDGAKVRAARAVIDALLAGMLATDEVGLVAFKNDAKRLVSLMNVPSARLAIAYELDHLESFGWTSIADGLFEAQSGYIEKGYDVDSTTSPVVLHSIALTDGKQNRSWALRDYIEAANQVSTDGVDDDDFDATDNGIWTKGASCGELSLGYRHACRAGGKHTIVPRVSAFAIGPDADLGELFRLASERNGNGVFARIDALYDTNTLPFFLFSASMQDAFRLATTMASGWQRVTGAYASAGQLRDVPLQVEAGADLMSLSVFSSEALARAHLFDPAGGEVMPSGTSGSALTFRVEQPLAGRWVLHAAPEQDALSFVDMAIAGPTLLASWVGVTGSSPALPPERVADLHTPGRPISLRAWLSRGKAIAGVALVASVQKPDKSLSQVEMFDDGVHADGEAGDGVFGAVYFETEQEGRYRFVIEAEGPEGLFVHRQAVHEVALTLPDADADGLPDAWERTFGLDPNKAASREDDADHDGLPDIEEYVHHTNPRDPDSDSGGESDGSEVARGSDPTSKGDDRWKPPSISFTPGRGKIIAQIPVPTRLRGLPGALPGSAAPTAGLSGVDFSCGGSPQGPFEQAEAEPIGLGVVALPAVDDTQGCCRARQRGDDGVSDWSAPSCVVPALDPNPPRATLSLPAGPASPTRLVTISIAATDEPLEKHLGLFVDAGMAETGVADMMVSERGDFVGASWQPFSPVAEAYLASGGGQLWVKVRDHAGNESLPVAVSVQIAAAPGLSKALTLEEEALDEMQRGAWSTARSLLDESLAQLRLATAALQGRRRATARDGNGKASPDDEAGLDEVDRVLWRGVIELKTSKLLIKGLTHAPSKQALARSMLRQTLEKERELWRLARREGRTL